MGNAGFSQLDADHVIPFKINRRGTTWQNMTLLCSPCNQKKNASLSLV
ncbi:MAG: hypothetical protein D5R98_00375 [Desulfonatronovibrio sp. MSAO_Bac4]|nr:MAG: hypothetical protein D5R98_00375 [Desulfonatronovibrio sp. MSAO_Bac4]